MKQRTIKKSIIQILFGFIFALTTIVSVALMQTSNLTAFAAASYFSGTLDYTGSEWTLTPKNGTPTVLAEGDEILNGYYDPQNTQILIYTNGFLGGSLGEASGIIAKIDGSTLYFCGDKDGHAQNKDATTKLCPKCSIHTVADIVKDPIVKLPEDADQIIPITTGREKNNWGEDGKTSWYVFEGYSGSLYGVMNGDVNLILLDGVSGSASIERGTNGNLTIWGQETGTGKLKTDHYDPEIVMDGGTLTINGGTIDVKNSYGYGAIKATTLNINGGTLIARGRNGIKAETINIAAGADILAGSSESDATVPTFDTNWVTTFAEKAYVRIIGPSHLHDWEYSSVGTNAIKAHCKDAKHIGDDVTLTLTAIDALATGNAYEGATLDSSDWESAGAEVPVIKYVGANYAENETAPTNGGAYTAKVTVGEVTISVDFKILGEVERYEVSNGRLIVYYEGISEGFDMGAIDVDNANNSVYIALIIVLAVLIPVAFCAGFFKDAIAKLCAKLFKKKN